MPSHSNSAFLKAEWPDLHDVASKAESPAELDRLLTSVRHRPLRGEL